MTYSHDSLLEMLRDCADTARKAEGVPMPQPNAAALEALPRPAAIRSDQGAAMTYTPDIRDVMHAAHYRYSPGQCEESLAAHDAEVRAQALAPIRDIHPDDDPIKCGWKQAVADIQAVLDRQEQPR